MEQEKEQTNNKQDIKLAITEIICAMCSNYRLETIGFSVEGDLILKCMTCGRINILPLTNLKVKETTTQPIKKPTPEYLG